MARRLDYGNLMHRAMRGLIYEVLTDVAAHGLPGEHHFFVTFDTNHPEVAIADWLSDRYPEEMTIVLQHWFEGLDVSDDGFAVTLNFGDAPERLHIPFDAIRTFVDPSVEFGLRFETQEDAAPANPDAPPPPASEPLSSAAPPAEKPQPKGDAEVVSLDKFRK